MPSPNTYTLSLHDALPISRELRPGNVALRDFEFRGRLDYPLFGKATPAAGVEGPLEQYGYAPGAFVTEGKPGAEKAARADEKERSEDTRLNSSHQIISYAVPQHLHSFPTRRSSDLARAAAGQRRPARLRVPRPPRLPALRQGHARRGRRGAPRAVRLRAGRVRHRGQAGRREGRARRREREIGRHTSELQSPDHLVCRPPTPTLFPYTTLFRSRASCGRATSPCATSSSAAASTTRSSARPRPPRASRGPSSSTATRRARSSPRASRAPRRPRAPTRKRDRKTHV